uniref:Uncharacterized protein n=1 Tax=Anguilla anguilla TaxID=7936 RepID=A0A0E9VP11_ANGAN
MEVQARESRPSMVCSSGMSQCSPPPTKVTGDGMCETSVGKVKGDMETAC